MPDHKSLPLILSDSMVRAILDGRKTMTHQLDTSPLRKVQPGDRLWVRETWSNIWPNDCDNGIVYDENNPGYGYRPVYLTECTIEYRADTDNPRPGDWPKDEEDAPRWRSPIHMPRWASRLTLEVTAIRQEHVQDISEIDAVAEGVQSVKAFANLWDTLHKKPGTRWADNPSVVAIGFRRGE